MLNNTGKGIAPSIATHLLQADTQFGLVERKRDLLVGELAFPHGM
jgi:hypothetical protein